MNSENPSQFRTNLGMLGTRSTPALTELALNKILKLIAINWTFIFCKHEGRILCAIPGYPFFKRPQNIKIDSENTWGNLLYM